MVFDKTGTLAAGQPLVHATRTERGLAAARGTGDRRGSRPTPSIRSRTPSRPGATDARRPTCASSAATASTAGSTAGVIASDARTRPPTRATASRPRAARGSSSATTTARSRSSSCSMRARAALPALLARLHRLGLGVEVLSGDAEAPVRHLCASLGIGTWHARQTPADKLERLRVLQARGHRVLMVGDGINDAPVLAGADVAAAMGTGSALAQTSADMVLTGRRPEDLADAIVHARRTLRVIRQNIAWAVGYNAIALPLAAAGLVAPWMAALGMSASSLLVVGNALRLGRRPSRPARTATARPPAAGEAA
ncbi:MAG: HAD-IC family P-type ATPase [Halofilum sp. (in: g-proteobacteria)]|nr:HAD-IC family P-type ATPase [Halofilum sp. (in: g-proteobacteria)]